MDYEAQIQRLEQQIASLEKRIESLEYHNKYKQCPRCYGKGYITSGYELDSDCYTCNGTGRIKRDE
jgi:DnaJ-class molecular chaperone